MSGDGAILELRGVRQNYAVRASFGRTGTLQALRGVDLSVAAGTVLGLVGESGCGKSTLARLLLGIEAPTEGEALIGGRRVTEYGRLERARLIQPVFQDPYSSLNPRMTVGGTIAAPLQILAIGDRASRAAKVADLMRFVGLAPELRHAYPAQLSGGQRQRVAIARALIAEPRILVCDEPTSALDVSVQAQILNLIARLHRELGTTVVLISHNLAVVEHLADRVAVMYLGRIVEEAPAAEIFARPRHPYARALLDAVLLPTGTKRLPAAPLGSEFPSALAPPSGCAFHPRCPKAAARCAEEDPRLATAGPGRSVACHFPED
jgi:peptide/nickel transport system ATP-binding protein